MTKKKKFVWMLIVALFIFSTQGIKAMEKEDKKILYLSTGKPNHIMPRMILNGFEAGLGSEYEVYVEYLGDLGIELRNNPEKTKKYFREIIETNLRKHKEFDVIVCVGDVAASLVIDNWNILKNSKMLFVNISDEKLITQAIKRKVGVIIKQNNLLKRNIDMIARMYRGERSIKVLTGPVEFNKKLLEDIAIIQNEYLDKGIKVEAISLSYKTKAEISNVLSSLDKKKDIALLMDPISELLIEGKQIENLGLAEIKNIMDVLNEVCKNGIVPVYSNIDTAIKSGMYGGIYTDLNELGKYCATKVLELHKYHSSELAVSPHKKSLDMQKVLLSGVKYKDIPKDAEKLVNNSIGGIYTYKTHIMVLFVVILGLVISILYVISKFKKERMRSNEISMLKDKAEQINKMKDSLINNISHELRTPVTVISSSNQLLKEICTEELKGSSIILENINIIDQNAYRLIRLINNVIDISNAESDYLTIERENVEAIGFIEDVVMSVVPFAKKKGLELVFDTEVEELIMAVDVNKVDRIILNVLSNAIKFTESGGNISVYISIEKDNLRLEVKDTGIGIDQKKLGVIFDKFTQIDTSLTRMNEGTGMGLAIVKTFVELHEGRFSVNSQRGIGATFIVELPIKLIENNDVKYIVERNEMNTISELSDIYL